MDFRTDKLLHGGDYNPEQWLKRPDILEKDIDMLEESGCNVVSLGIFSWSTLEPEEGVFHFEWLQEIIDKLYKRGISTILATPSGARPKWMADKYPEVLRVDETRHRALFGFRHNHCYTSPVYREKVHIINKKLAQEVATHPGVILWHISNEYGGECHCPLCQEAFRNWLKEKYQTIENLNDKWCTTFWSHTYNSFDQIESPSKIGETQLHALNLDWKRFVTHQTADFIHHEIAALREGGSTLPTTANLMHYFGGLDYFKIAKEIDVVSWDTYPTWHKEAVIDHYGGNDTRVFKEVSRVGEVLKELKELAGTTVNSSVAMLYDWDSQWAMEDSQGPRNKGLHYLEAMLKFYRGFRKQGVNVDVIDMTCELDKYQVLALPMVYMFKEGFAKKVRAFVENGGTLITSYWSGIADDTDRCYLEGTPHGLMDVLGIRSTEIDGLYDWEENSFVPVAGNELGLDKTYTCKYLCDLVELRGARTLMTYGSDFYEGYSCLTVNEYGKGKAWYVAADADKEFYGDFLEKVLKDSGVSCGIKEEIPDALEITVRENENEKYYIYQNFGTEAVSIPVPEGQISWIYGNGSDKLKVYGLAVAKVIV